MWIGVIVLIAFACGLIFGLAFNWGEQLRLRSRMEQLQDALDDLGGWRDRRRN
jgi:hypothetical protein